MNEKKILDMPITDPLQSKVYSKNQIGLGTFIGGPLAATYMIAENYKIFGEPNKAQKTWIWGGIGTFIFVILVLFMPESIRGIIKILPIDFAYLILINLLVQIYQVKLIIDYTNKGGQLFNWGRTVLITVIGLILMLIIFY